MSAVDYAERDRLAALGRQEKERTRVWKEHAQRWRLGITCPDKPVGTGHEPTVEDRWLHPGTKAMRLQYRGRCLKAGCSWMGPERSTENAAVEDGHDHAWPGWRELPVLDEIPYWGSSPKQEAAGKARLERILTGLYPTAFLTPGAPIRTRRGSWAAGRHVPGRAPWGGYDLAGEVPPRERRTR